MFQNVGCDFQIDSGAVEDRCGVCHGNGSTCHTVNRTFEESEGLGTCWGPWLGVLLTWRPLLALRVPTQAGDGKQGSCPAWSWPV